MKLLRRRYNEELGLEEEYWENYYPLKTLKEQLVFLLLIVLFFVCVVGFAVIIVG